MSYGPRGQSSSRLPFAGSPNPWTLRLVLLNVIVFVVQLMVMRTPLGAEILQKWFFLTPAYFFRGAFWELITYMFMHSPQLGYFLLLPIPTHLFFNMFLLWMFGREVEIHLGGRAFLQLYFIAGIVAGLCALITLRPTIGASGAVLGILAAFGHLFPDRIILVFFILPMKVRYFIWAIAAIDLLGAVSGGGSIAHLAHIGGLFTGMLLMRTGWYRKRILDLEGWRRGYERSRERKRQERVNAILDKVSEKGIDSLTRDEREFLERMRKGR